MYCHTVWCIVTHRVFCVVLDLLMHCRRIAGVLSPTFRFVSRLFSDVLSDNLLCCHVFWFVFRLFSDVLSDNLLCCHAFWCTVIVLLRCGEKTKSLHALAIIAHLILTFSLDDPLWPR